MPLAATYHGCGIEWIEKTLWFLDYRYIIRQELVDILTQQVSSPDNSIDYANIAQYDKDENTADEDYLIN